MERKDAHGKGYRATELGVRDIESAKHIFRDCVSPSAAILVVDDDEFVLEIVRLLLVRAGYCVLTAQNAEEAWNLLVDKSHEIRLLLADIVMPDSLDGFELAEQVWKEQPDLPVLFMTGAALQDHPSMNMLDREPRVLRKPFSPEQLLTFVKENLESANRPI